jgi:RNA-directed DNA polymerase
MIRQECLGPLLANSHLDTQDWLMAGIGFEMERCADDMLVMCRSQQEADSALGEFRK